MKVVLVHNEYGVFGGEEAAVCGLRKMLEGRGHDVVSFIRSSDELSRARTGSMRGFLCGLWNPFARLAFGRLVELHEPDVIHVHNVFPLISPSVVVEARRRGKPTVMTLHNYRLVCPNALLMRKGEVCRECLGGREWQCVRRNCEGQVGKSLGYALRTGIARRTGAFLRNVEVFICLTEFQRAIHVREGFPSDRCVVVGNFARDGGAKSGWGSEGGAGALALYVGRVSPEKDMYTLMDAARRLPDVPFKIAGSYHRMREVVKQGPDNVEFLGQVETDQVRELYGSARIVVFATRCYEGFPMVLVEAMMHGKPIVCTRIGGLPEVVEDGVTGLLYEGGDGEDLAGKIRELWSDLARCRELGEAGRTKVQQKYSEDVVYEKLMGVYARAIEHAGSKKGRTSAQSKTRRDASGGKG